MSNGRDLSKTLNFRGSPNDLEDFYMVARIKQSSISDFKSKTTPDFNKLGENSDKFFFLCLNQYVENKDPLMRLYWSSDPDDFQYNMGGTYLNQGAVRVNASKDFGSYNLKFRTVTNGHTMIGQQGHYKNFTQNLNRITGNESSYNVTIVPKENYNLNSNFLYYSIPYQITASDTYQISTMNQSTSNNIEWFFRKVSETAQSSGTRGNTLSKPESSGAPYYTDRIYNFVDAKFLNTQAGTDSSYFNYGNADYVYVTGVSTAAAFKTDSSFLSIKPKVSDFSDFPRKNGNFILFQGGTSTAIHYKHYVPSTAGVSFILDDHTHSRGLLGSDIESTIPVDTGVSLLLNKRNTSKSFTKLPAAVRFEDVFDIFLIPTENTAIFPGGWTINNPNVFPPCDSANNSNILTPRRGDSELEFYSNISRKPHSSAFTAAQANNYVNCTSDPGATMNIDKLYKYKKISTLFMFQFLGSLPFPTWTTRTMDKYPLIATFYEDPKYMGEGSYPITFFSWDDREQARNAFAYDYCEPGEYCGFCYGNSRNGVASCYADRSTRKNAVLTTSAKSLPPLTGTMRATGTHSNPGNTAQTGIIIVGVVLGIMLLFVIVLLVKYNEEKKRDATEY